ncbi:cysteine desulfurase-like protein [Oscillatoria sp. FACHB-1407]|uniref:cysteine desulfurase-like protein n=1 Tax=Oscillatoria sp. FACHB-1407 TaxID=2692847 RepID=UPI001687F634|nr:cysteine desulfurase-like protein [Oscillatoria sp. FACHB-1407]MBD2465203.1 cysteine desulfurase-like protein [Oscillatoria sp. FACHB-1407]
MVALDLDFIRGQFPALSQEVNGQPVVFFDGPGGTQVPQSVMDAIANYLTTSNANTHGAFVTSVRTDDVITAARTAMAVFLGCDADEVVFGANMTTLTFAVSRAIGRELQAGDEIVVTRLDHDANVTPWTVLEEQGAVIRVVDIHPEDCTLDMADLERQISDRTKMVAVGYASNAVGTINDVKAIAQLAHAVGALVFVDAVHYAPHGPIDVRAIDCDFLACSAYKFFGPHVGILYGKRDHLARLRPYKVRPASEEGPSRWESGTQNFEGFAGVVATIAYLTELGYHISPTAPNRRTALLAAMSATQDYERELFKQLVPRLLEIPGLTFYGIADPARFEWRTPTAAIRLEGHTPRSVAQALGDRGIFVWNGNFYALNLTQRLDLESSGGLVRIGLAHYTTSDEIDRLLKALDDIVS